MRRSFLRSTSCATSITSDSRSVSPFSAASSSRLSNWSRIAVNCNRVSQPASVSWSTPSETTSCDRCVFVERAEELRSPPAVDSDHMRAVNHPRALVLQHHPHRPFAYLR